MWHLISNGLHVNVMGFANRHERTVLTAGEAILFGSAVHVPARVQISAPSHTPWSNAAAPYFEWTQEQRFPVADVLRAWGIAEAGDGEAQP